MSSVKIMPKQASAIGDGLSLRNCLGKPQHVERSDTLVKNRRKLGDIFVCNDKYLNHILSIHNISLEEYEIGRNIICDDADNYGIVEYGKSKGIDIVLYLYILGLYSRYEANRFVRYYSSMLKRSEILGNIFKDYCELKAILCDELVMLTFIAAIQYYFL